MLALELSDVPLLPRDDSFLSEHLLLELKDLLLLLVHRLMNHIFILILRCCHFRKPLNEIFELFTARRPAREEICLVVCKASRVIKEAVLDR